MKALNIVLLLLIFITVSHAQDNWFLRTILDDDYCRTCYFLSIEVESNAYNGRVVLEKDDFFDFVKSTRGLGRSEFKEFAYDMLTNNRKLNLQEHEVNVNKDTALSIGTISENLFRIVPQIPEFEEVASKGCIEFIKEFFIEDADIKETNNNSKNVECREFVLGQNKNLSTVRRLSAIEESFVIDKLFHWQIPVINDHYKGLTIRRYALVPRGPNSN
jgi:hypothetical protein